MIELLRINFKDFLLLTLILIFAYHLRFYGLDWDSGRHMHPDERMLIMVTATIQFPNNLNPDFFNYGSLPIYTLAGTAQFLDYFFNTSLDNYDGLLYVGRFISLFIDLLILLLIFKVTEILFKNKMTSFLASIFYALTFFPIQNSHFFIVDNFLSLFVLLQVYVILLLFKNNLNHLIVALFSGTISAAIITTKVTGVLFLPLTFLFIIVSYVIKNTSFLSWKNLFKNKLKIIIKSTLVLFVYTSSLLAFSFLFMPYAFLNSEKFINEITLQLKMNSNPYIFPYTLQYVGTIPYWYYIKNIFLWGAGPILSSLFLIGLTYNFKQILKFIKEKQFRKISLSVIFITFYLLYFLVIGRSSVKFMRYMLLLYPVFAIYGASAGMMLFVFLKDKFTKSKNVFIRKIPHFYLYILIFSVFIWCLTFINIYSKENTRITATNWIFENIKPGSTIGVEHWDDRVPIIDDGRYTFQEMTLYDIPDNDTKWNFLNEKIKNSDYIILASNRLYVPLMRLQECGEYGRCYPLTKKYYEDLFSGKLGFKKVAEFTSYPHLTILNKRFEIVDDSADESFTVYDHPKIMIFERLK